MMTMPAPAAVLPRVRGPSRRRAALAARGLVAIGFAAGASVIGNLPLSFLAVTFALFLLAGAAAALFDAIVRRSRSLLFLSGVSLALGAFLWVRPWPSQRLFVYLAGAWAMLAGLLESIAAGTWRRDRPTEWLEAGAGAAWLIVGAALGVFPETDAAPTGRLLALGALVAGLCLCAAALRGRTAADPER
jgi:uncharacterized membrane protein HdeD (DUF308 family)